MNLPPELRTNPNRITGDEGETALIAAIRDGDTERVKNLLRHPAIDVNRADDHNRTPLWWAAFEGRTEAVRMLLAERDINVNKTCISSFGDGQPFRNTTPLYMAARHNHTDIVRMLVERPDTDLNVLQCNGFSALGVALNKGHLGAAAILEQAGAHHAKPM